MPIVTLGDILKQNPGHRTTRKGWILNKGNNRKQSDKSAARENVKDDVKWQSNKISLQKRKFEDFEDTNSEQCNDEEFLPTSDYGNEEEDKDEDSSAKTIEPFKRPRLESRGNNVATPAQISATVSSSTASSTSEQDTRKRYSIRIFERKYGEGRKLGKDVKQNREVTHDGGMNRKEE